MKADLSKIGMPSPARSGVTAAMLMFLVCGQVGAIPMMEIYADSTIAGMSGFLVRHGDTAAEMHTYFLFEENGQVRFSHIRWANTDEWLAYPPGSYLTPPVQSPEGYEWSCVPSVNHLKTATIEHFVRRDVPAGRFLTASCAIRLNDDPDHVDEYMSLAEDVGIVRRAILPSVEEWILTDYRIEGGSGYLPLAVGNYWIYEESALSGVGYPAVAAITALSCFPNPFNPQTTIAFELPRQEAVTLCVFDVAGSLVQTLIGGGVYEPGRNEVVWNGRDGDGRRCSSGTYFFRLESGGYSETKRMTLIK